MATRLAVPPPLLKTSRSKKRLVDVQQALGDTLNLDEARQPYIWNGPNHSMTNVMKDRFAFEFNVDAFRPPYTYKADEAATIFLTHGFVVWFRSYGGSFRLLAIPMADGVYDSAWGDYVARLLAGGRCSRGRYDRACHEKASLSLGDRPGICNPGGIGQHVQS